MQGSRDDHTITVNVSAAGVGVYVERDSDSECLAEANDLTDAEAAGWLSAWLKAGAAR